MSDLAELVAWAVLVVTIGIWTGIGIVSERRHD